MPVSLTTLPPELFGCIVANIEPLPILSPCVFNDVKANFISQATLLSLAQCSRQSYLYTIPRLYHHVIVQDEQLRTLASLLIRRPDLAGLVRYFTLHGESLEIEYSDELEESEDSEYSQILEDPEDSEDSEEPEEPEEPREDVIPGHVEVDQSFKIAVNAFNLSAEEKKYWLRRLSHAHGCHPDLILALLLPALLKVEGVFLAMNIGFDTHYLEQIIGRATRRERPFDVQPAFEALKVFFHPLGYSNVRSTGFIASLLKLPAIQDVSVGCGNKRDDFLSEDTNLKEMDSNSSPLISFDLSAYVLSTADLGHMLRAPEALEDFFYNLRPFIDTSFTDVRHALVPQENSLRYLGFGIGFHEDYEVFLVFPGERGGEDSGEYFGPMTSFISFNALKVFETPAVLVQKTANGTKRDRLINIFPPNLEMLHLTRCEVGFEGLVEAVEHLLAQTSPQQLPFLNELLLEEGPMSKVTASLWKGTHKTSIESLTMVAAARGICIKLL